MMWTYTNMIMTCTMGIIDMACFILPSLLTEMEDELCMHFTDWSKKFIWKIE